MADIKISELEPTTDLEGLYTIGSDKNNLSKKVSLQFLKDAANYANEQGDYAKQAGDTVNGNVGVSDYPEFSASKSYVIGDIVRYNGVLYSFTANHAASAWNGSDVKATSINAITSGKLTELESEVNSNIVKPIKWDNGSYSPTNPITLTERGDRLRSSDFIKVNKGTRIKVEASSSQWVVINQFYLDLSDFYSRDVQIYDNVTVIIEQDCMILPVIGNTDNSNISQINKTSNVEIYPALSLEDNIIGPYKIVTGDTLIEYCDKITSNIASKITSTQNTTISFIGKGTELSETPRYGLVAGRKYQLFLPNTNWEKNETGTETTDYVFVVRSFINESENGRLIKVYRTDDLKNSYEFVAPENTEIRIGGRANLDIEVQVVIKDITEDYLFANKIDGYTYGVSMPINWVNGSYSAIPPILTDKSNRLRSSDFIRVNKGTRIKVEASGSQWVVINQFYLDLSDFYSRDVQIYDNVTVIIEQDCMILPVIGNTDNSNISQINKTSNVKIYPFLDLIDVYKGIEASVAIDFKNLDYALAAKKRATISNDVKNNHEQYLTVVHITDTHGDAVRTERAFQVAEKLNAIVVCSGDMLYYYNTDDYSYMKIIQDKYPNVIFLPCIGNHEAWVQEAYTQNDYTPLETLYNKIIVPSQGKATWIYPSGVNYPTYYYYDNDTYKIRFISLNKYVEVNRKEYMPQDEVDFLCNALESLPSEYGVVVIMHSAEGQVKKAEGYDKFLTKEYSSGYTGSGLVKKIIDAFISRKAIDQDYSFPKGNVNVVGDFSNNTNNDFIGYMVGHIHYDGIGYVADVDNTQLVLCETCTNNFINLNKDGTFSLNSNNPDLNEWSDLARQDNSVNQDAFNVYVIDKEKGNIRIVRIGSDLTYDFKKRDYMIIPYK